VNRWAAADIEHWLLQRLQSRLGAGAEVVDRHLPFSYYGLDSIDAVELAAELEEWLGQPVSASLTFDYPTVSAVATYLAAEAVSAPAPDGADVQALLTELAGPSPDRSSPSVPTPPAPVPADRP
jgi:acyl carrier protein